MLVLITTCASRTTSQLLQTSEFLDDSRAVILNLHSWGSPDSAGRSWCLQAEHLAVEAADLGPSVWIQSPFLGSTLESDMC